MILASKVIENLTPRDPLDGQAEILSFWKMVQSIYVVGKGSHLELTYRNLYIKIYVWSTATYCSLGVKHLSLLRTDT